MTTAQRSLLAGQFFYFVAEITSNAELAGAAVLSDAEIFGKTSLLRRVHNDHLRCSEESSHVGVGPPKTQFQSKNLSQP